ncbi:hypothetical protein Tco_0904261, partial [Tanacetum coccineum]
LFLFPYVEDLRMRILPMFNTISSIRIEFLYTLIHPSGSSFFNIIIVEDNCWKLVKDNAGALRIFLTAMTLIWCDLFVMWRDKNFFSTLQTNVTLQINSFIDHLKHKESVQNQIHILLLISEVLEELVPLDKTYPDSDSYRNI